MAQSAAQSEDVLPPPKGYIADKVSLVTTAVLSALRSLGLTLRTADDSIAAPNMLPGEPAASSSPKQHPILQDIGASVDRALQDIATTEPHTRQLLSEALEEERAHAAAPSAHKSLQ